MRDKPRQRCWPNTPNTVLGERTRYLSSTNFLVTLVIMVYVYILQADDGTIYYGSTRDLRRRLAEHRSGKSTYTRSRKWRLIYYEAYLDERDARNRERHLKRYGQSRTHLKRRLNYSLQKISAG